VDEGGRAVKIRRGELYRLAGDDHPHVIVQDDVFNDSRISTVVVCALTSNLNAAKDPGNVLLAPGEGNLPRQSVVVTSKIDSVDKRRLGDPLGALSQERVEEILAGLRFLQTSYFS
jgi:mRNA interferase MazF